MTKDIKIEYRYETHPLSTPLSDVVFKDDLPQGVEVVEIGKECNVENFLGLKKYFVS